MDYARLPLTEVLPGMVLARPLTDARGQVLLPAGVVLTDAILHRLARWGVESAAVKVERGARGRRRPVFDTPRPDPRVGAVLRQETFADAAGALRHLVEEIVSGAAASVQAAEAVVNSLLADILANLEVVSALVSLKDADDYSYRHSVGTCTIALAAGARMQYPRQSLLEIGLAALLADVGMTRIPRAILGKAGRLTGAEWAEVRRHPRHGYEMLRNTPGISPLVAAVVLQHHERWDGSGYPHGLEGPQIHPYAQLVALADVYDAMTSGRPYALASPPFVAAEDLLQMAGRLFDRELTLQFVASLLNHQPGSPVELSDGSTALILSRHPQHPTRPTVVPCDADGNPTAAVIDLTERRDLHITRLLGDPQLGLET